VLLYSSLSLLQKRKDLKPILGVKSSSILRSQRKNPPASLIVECKVQGISNDAQNVSPDNKIYCKKVKMCQFSSGNWFFGTKFLQLAVVGKWPNTVVLPCAPPKTSVINWM
jgi:hypothetical protein